MKKNAEVEELDSILALCDGPHDALVSLAHLQAETFQPPGQVTFEVLLAFLDKLPNDRLETALRAADDGLNHYPSSARRILATDRSLSLVLQRRGWSLARNLTVTLNGTIDTSDLREMLSGESMRHIEKLCFLGKAPEQDVIRAIGASPALKNLKALEFACSEVDNVGEALRSTPLIATLRELHPSRVTELTSVPELALEVVSCDGTPEIISILDQHCPHLKELHLSVDLDKIGPTLSALTSSQSLAGRLHNLKIGPTVDTEAFQILLTCRHLSNLRCLDVGVNVGGPGLGQFHNCTFLPQLTYLRLANNPLGGEGWSHLAAWPLDSLRTLDLSFTGGGDEGAVALAASPNLRQVRHVELEGNSIGSIGFQSLAHSPLLEAVEYLNLNDNPISGDDARILASCTHMEALRNLLITAEDVNAAIAIAETPHLVSLEGLHLSYPESKGKATRALCGSAAFANLLRLRIGTSLDDSCVKTLSECDQLETLRSLILAGNVTATGVRALSQSSVWENLWELDLSMCPIGDEGAKAIAESSRFSRLNSLQLIGCGLTAIGSAALANSTNMRRLQSIGLKRSLLAPWLQSKCISPVLRMNLQGITGQNSCM